MRKLIDITPSIFRCGSVVTGCESIFRTEKTYIIIGKIVFPDDYTELSGRIGKGEMAIEVSVELIKGAIENG